MVVEIMAWASEGAKQQESGACMGLPRERAVCSSFDLPRPPTTTTTTNASLVHRLPPQLIFALRCVCYHCSRIMVDKVRRVTPCLCTVRTNAVHICTVE